MAKVEVPLALPVVSQHENNQIIILVGDCAAHYISEENQHIDTPTGPFRRDVPCILRYGDLLIERRPGLVNQKVHSERPEVFRVPIERKEVVDRSLWWI